MKAVRVNEFGGPEALVYEEIPDPAPGEGEALVKIGASGINYIDVYYRTGQYPADPPFTSGQEAAGTVESVGDGVEDLSAGDNVALRRRSGFVCGICRRAGPQARAFAGWRGHQDCRRGAATGHDGPLPGPRHPQAGAGRHGPPFTPRREESGSC